MIQESKYWDKRGYQWTQTKNSDTVQFGIVKSFFDNWQRIILIFVDFDHPLQRPLH